MLWKNQTILATGRVCTAQWNSITKILGKESAMSPSMCSKYLKSNPEKHFLVVKGIAWHLERCQGLWELAHIHFAGADHFLTSNGVPKSDCAQQMFLARGKVLEIHH